MRVVAGIDLGSTTTKAVLLDFAGQVVGKGITNSRSNYDVACAVALAEARVDARLARVRAALAREEALGGGDGVAGFLRNLEQGFRLAQHRLGLERLRALAVAEAGAPRHGAEGSALRAAVEEILTAMDGEAKSLFLFGQSRKSDFFRDLAQSHYQKAAERVGKRQGLRFESLMGIFDKCILGVENEALEIGFAESAGRAAAAALDRARLDRAEVRARIEALVRGAAEEKLEEVLTIGTGYGRQRLPFPRECIRSEILCHGLGAHHMFPRTATVLDIGGQDTKAIQVDGLGIVTSFQMNDRCAAGCGRYLGYIADEMNLGLHELGPLAQQAQHAVKINSTCTVFAGAELRDRLTLGQRREDILAGLHRAIVLRALSLLARSGGVRDEFTFTGGVAKNPAAVAALLGLIRENYGERTVNISPDSIYTGAIGAALFAARAASGKEAAA